MARRQKRGLKPNFFLRRIFLLGLLIVTVIGAIWAVRGVIAREETDLPELSEQSEPESSEPEASQPEASPDPEPEPEPEPEPDTRLAGTHPDDAWRIMLVGPSNPLGREYVPPELDYITGEYAVDARIAPALRRMIADAKLEGVALMICSAYRDADYQEVLHNRQIDYYHLERGLPEDEAVAAASAVVVPPGTSEHQTGLAVDIVEPDYQVLDDGFADTLAAKWLYDNAWKYGFVLRYPKDKTEITKVIFEPWHYRYVGEEHAAYIREHEICLEEYLWQHSAMALNPVPEAGETEEEPE